MKAKRFNLRIVFIRKIGEPGAIRTPGPQIRSLMLYPAELRVHLWRRLAGRGGHCKGENDGCHLEMALGRVIRNSVPSASDLASSNWPPWPRINSAAMVRPRPVPPLRAPP